MGIPKKHQKVKLIIGFIFRKEDALNKSELLLKKLFGEVDFQSQPLLFIYTDYYEKEFGKGLKRKFISFKKLIKPQDLGKIKILTNRIENKLSNLGMRLINIDPGYLDLAKLVLASTKDFKHRICQNHGIFLEVTLFYQDKTFLGWPWTYPDYQTPEYIVLFNQIRKIYAGQIK